MAAEKQPNFAVSYKLDSRSIRTVTGFDTAAEATLWLRWSSTMDRAIRGDNGLPAVVDVVTVAQANKVSDKEGWNEYIQARRAEKAREEQEAREAHEAQVKAEQEASLAAEVERQTLERFKDRQRAELAKIRAQVEKELAN
jgi:hypothetical protein